MAAGSGEATGGLAVGKGSARGRSRGSPVTSSRLLIELASLCFE